jgi:hypothetical protein
MSGPLVRTPIAPVSVGKPQKSIRPCLPALVELLSLATVMDDVKDRPDLCATSQAQLSYGSLVSWRC